MPFNGSGTFNRVFNWATDKANSIDITASRFDTEDNGFATGLSNCITRDGQGQPTATTPWNNQQITNCLAITLNQDPVSALQAATKQYVDFSGQKASASWGATAGGTPNAITITLAPVPAAYTDGMLVAFLTGASANTGAVTVNANTLGAKNLVRNDGVALANGDLPASSLVVARYDATAGNLKMESVVPSQWLAANNTWSGTNTWNGTSTWNAAGTWAVSGATPQTIRRTENDTTEREFQSIQSGSGAGNALSWRILGGGSNNVAEFRGYIGATKFIDILASGAVTFPQIVALSNGVDVAEISTPAAPAAGSVRTYAKSSGLGFSDILAYQTPGGAERLLVGDATGKFLIASGNIPTATTAWDISVPADAQEIEVEIMDMTVATGGGQLNITYKVGGTNVAAGYILTGPQVLTTTVTGINGASGAFWGVFPPGTAAPDYRFFKLSGIQNGFRKKMTFMGHTSATYEMQLGDCGNNTGLVSDILFTSASGGGNFTGGTFRAYKIK